MSPRKRKRRYLSIVMLAAITVMPRGSVSIAQEQADSATERLKKISSAMSTNDLAEIRSLIERGADVSAALESGITPLHVAAFQGHPKIVELLLDAGAKENADAQVNLGNKYASGRGVPRDQSEAVKWYRKAAEKGDAQAQNSLGMSCLRGNGAPQDSEEAAKWFRKAAEQGRGVAGAQFLLGSMYLRGNGVPQDSKEAAKWIRKAAEKGDTQAQETLAKMYLQGDGVPQDAEEAAKWLKKLERVHAAMGEMAFTRPAILGDIRPPCTDEARNAGISGTVTVQCMVRTDGTADSCRILKGLGYGLDESAVKTIEKEGRFTPAKVKDDAIDGPINISIYFSISRESQTK